MMEIIKDRFIKYLLLFVSELILIYAIAFIDISRHFFSESPSYWLPITVFAFIILSFVWSFFATGGYKISQIICAIFSGALTSGILLLCDSHLREVELSILHLRTVEFLNKNYELPLLIVISDLIQLIFWEFMKVIGVISLPQRYPVSANL
ncbi:MAG TPA: hypothetical protein VK806_09590 [Bacteroidia bacterium]|jgi:hypothetical protein|nr:hypothetical protein [Bacteroidia bacterium]